MFLVNLKENKILEESQDSNIPFGWHQMCQADPSLFIFDTWPVPRMKVLAGKLVEKPEKEWKVPFDITLDELRKKRKRELFTKYAEKCEEGVEFEGSKFQSSERSANRIGLALQDWIRGIPISYWVRKDNSHHEITSYPQIDSLAIAISKRWRFLLHINTSLRDEIDSLSPNELLSLDVSSRWQEIEEEISE